MKKIKLRPMNSRDIEARVARISQDIADLHNELYEAGKTAWFDDLPALRAWSNAKGNEIKVSFEIGDSHAE